MAVEDQTKAYPMIQLSSPSNLAGQTVPLKPSSVKKTATVLLNDLTPSANLVQTKAKEYHSSDCDLLRIGRVNTGAHWTLLQGMFNN
jgi:hypothetical protein